VLIDGRRVRYDQLIVATSARETHFVHGEWAAVTSRLTRIEDATTMRRRILVAFERAEDAEDASRIGPDLTLPGHPEIFVIGDTALVVGPDGSLSGVAQVAKQQGAYAARVIAARLAGNPAPPRFGYLDFGNLATIGRREAVVDFGWLKLTGRIAWLVWGDAHIYFLIGFRNRMVIALDWLWSYLTYRRGARLITGQDL
jgi:NADH:ubiquinone reductase (H+-translocating)